MKKSTNTILAVARAQLGVTEIGTSNAGPQVNAYLASVGLGPGYPWCAAFVYWCAGQACRTLAVPNPLVKTGYCPTIAHWAEQHDILFREPRAGDVFLLYSSKLRRYAHTGLVEKVAGGTIRTLEGNTNTDGSRNGVGVFALTRPVGARTAFARIDSLLANVGQPPPSTEVTLALGDQRITVPLLEGAAWVPVRKVAEHFQVALKWVAADRSIALDGEPYEGQLAFRPGPGGSPVAFAAARDLAAALDLAVTWDDPTRTVALSR